MKQSDKAQLEWLASFYREAADTGREMQTLYNGKWTQDNFGPRVGSKPSNWRLNPVPQKAYLIWVGDGLGTVFETRESAELYCRVYSAPTQIQEVERAELP